ncbi:DUF2516 family protein [Phytoactinopolyspora endophytica]|uniref:DUF2516 family protein n=1 Tax=Phytoactinopolyspora endophytica TaxID=1642495 RepID=UPI00197BB516|nr:DUF2516 family protein [Phytoactinopolyspora endophytica]
MDLFGDFQSLLLAGLAVVALGMKTYALIDAVRVPTAAFPAAGKLTKPIWLAILVVALVIELAVFPSPLFFGNLLGTVGAAVYLVDVRPAVRAMGGGRRGSSSDGPYGSW